MLNLNNVYNYYSTQIVSHKSNARFNSHKKDDLKTVYQNMVKQNISSPFYKFTFSGQTQAYTIGIKEAAMALEAESQSLSSRNTGALEEMMAVSDNESVVFANLNDYPSENLPEELSIQVKSLATGQVNVGSYLPSGEASFTPGEYSFGITVRRNQYTFGLTVHDNDTNLAIQSRLANSINNNQIGVRASIRSNRTDGTSALVIRSDAMGITDEHDETIFRFDETYLENDIASALGIEHVESSPSNAEFYINDSLHQSISNRISLNHSIDIDLLSTNDAPVTVRLVPDENKLSNRLADFITSYNQLVDIAKNGAGQKGASRLLKDITNISRRHQEALQEAGITIDEDGYLQQTDDIDSDRIHSLFNEELSSFRRDIKRTTEKMTLNPLDYIDKVVVTYPNTGKAYPNPYHPSKYSGLLFNDYA
ncbi:MAG: hypothetical protein NC300_08880 [Bacteroidales bacterium]|nr:hypothetical protein [Clostridium sp.]MCM1204243.1 hypothetical protein [Bacteroidales bacterium]